MNYNDLSKAEVRERFPQVVAQLRKGDLVLPAVYVDEELVSLGYVDYFTIARALEKAQGNGRERS